MHVVTKLLDLSGIGRERLRVEWISSAEAKLFAEYVSQFSGYIKKIGPFNPKSFKLKLDAMEQTLRSDRIRWFIGIKKQMMQSGNVYGERIDEDRYERSLQEMLLDEYEKSIVLESIRDGIQHVNDISKNIKMPVHKVSWYINQLRRDGSIVIESYERDQPRFSLNL